MDSTIRKLAFLLTLSSLVFVLLASVSHGQTRAESKALDVTFCDLLKDPAKFDAQTIRVTAIYRYGMYWNEIYCLECDSSGRISVSFGNDFDSRTKKKYRKSIRWSDLGRTVRVTAIGVFSASGQYGHRGELRYQLEIQQLESADVLSLAGDYMVPSDGKKCLVKRE